MVAAAGSFVRSETTNAVAPVISYQFQDVQGEAIAVSPVVSYQYLDSQGESGNGVAAMSPVVSYQYYDFASNVTQQSSLIVSYFYQGSSSTLYTPTISSVNPNPVPAQDGQQTSSGAGQI